MSRLHLRILISTFTALIGTLAVTAQVDFNQVKDRYTLTCEVPTKEQLQANLHFVDSLWAVGVSEGRMDFLYKRGFTHYMCWLTYNETTHVEQAIESFRLGWDEYEDSTALWNLVVILTFNDRCDEALPMIDTLERLADQVSHIELEELTRLRTKCSSNATEPSAK
jgi:hypothetical protein